MSISLAKDIINTIKPQLDIHLSASPKVQAIRTAANVVLGGVQVRKADVQLTEPEVNEIVEAFSLASGYVFGYDFECNKFIYPPELVTEEE